MAKRSTRSPSLTSSKRISRSTAAVASMSVWPSDANGGSLSISEETFLSMRDSFYMASVSETGWPYIQHHGGAAGFVKILAPDLIGFADLRGNKQYISLRNLEHDARIALFFMDYPNQTRLKVLGRVEIHEKDSESATLIERLRTTHSGYEARCGKQAIVCTEDRRSQPADMVRAMMLRMHGSFLSLCRHFNP